MIRAADDPDFSRREIQLVRRNAFEKAGMKSRRELLKRLFFEDLLPNAPGR